MIHSVKKIQHSITAKLLGIFIITALVVVALLWELLNITFEKKVADTVTPYFSKYLIHLHNDIGSPPDLQKARQLTLNNPVNIVIETPTYNWSSNNTFINKSHLDIKGHHTNKSGITYDVGLYKGKYILRTVTDNYTIYFIIIEKIRVTLPLKDILIITAVILILITLLYIAIYYMFAPVKVIERGIKIIGDGEVSHRINITSQDEIGSLSRSVNKMANNIESMLAAKRQLLLSISHELRTPITRARIALSLMETSNLRESVAEDISEMETLIHELLESEKLRGGHAPLELMPSNINDIIDETKQKFFSHENIELELDDSIPYITIDASRIGLAVKNLIKNGIMARTTENGKIIVQTTSDDTHAIVSVIDYGKGIESAQIPKLTEPFYRVDESRQRTTGGFGVGLYLIKAIVEAHKGRLIINSEIGKGTTVIIMLPLNTPSQKT